MHVERLKTLAAFLRSPTVTGKFDMRCWGAGLYGTLLPERVLVEAAPNCHTTACALGWGTVCLPAVFEFKFEDGATYVDLVGSPVGNSVKAAAEGFDINGDVADFLFTPDGTQNFIGNLTPESVANRIDFIVEGGDPDNWGNDARSLLEVDEDED